MGLPLTLSTTQCILHRLRSNPDALAVIEQNGWYSYADMAAGIARYVKALRATGLRSGMLVGIECDYRYIHLTVILACGIVEATVVSLSANDIAARDSILERCDLLCLKTELAEPPAKAGLFPLTQEAIDRIARIPVGAADFDLLDHCPTDDAILSLIKTSGSTGRPKVLAVSYEKTKRRMDHTLDFPNDPGFGWNFLNLYGFNLRSACVESMAALRVGGTVVSSQLWSLWDDMRRFDEFRTTLLSGDAVRLAHAIPKDWSGPRTGVIHIKGGALPASIRETLNLRIASHVYLSYGAIEISRLATIDGNGNYELTPGSNARIVAADGRETAPGEIGTIEAKSDMMLDAYLWDEAASRAAFRDGWYCTNDLGYMLESGQFVVLGRADDVVILGGNKFSPLMVEQEIREIDGVEDAVLIAIPDRSGTDVAHLVLQSADPRIFARIEAHVVTLLSGYVPMFQHHALAALPRTETGKVRRLELRRMLSNPLEDCAGT
jgi:acyl-coenzyme A synthetase/AMP-(fatty) acid ligase